MSRTPQMRAIEAAEMVLRIQGTVNLFDVFGQLCWLQASHFRFWEKGEIDDLFSCIASTPARRRQVILAFQEWAAAKGLKRIEIQRQVRLRSGVRELTVTSSGDAEIEAAFRAEYLHPNTSARKQAAVKKKAEKPPDIVVYIKQGRSESECIECGTPIPRRHFFFTEDKQAFCLKCADLDHLEFLPSGNATLSRRARKYSPLNAVVVEWSRRKRYERRGILVLPGAIEKAEEECLADADLREARRLRSQERRDEQDEEYRLEMIEKIAELFPGCPQDEVESIAAHTTLRGSDRVGRTAAAKEFDADAIRHAVVAHIRHTHTRYDLMLMGGTPRQAARQRIRADVDQVLHKWRSG